ncbi:hypothetical protein [Micromonospora sp. SH-82]|uniref:hypothetical protein n=1 Tax=Micromonospora sp. SH-82 TaxID=3132938 RepID=UPI003EB6EC59
MNVAVPAGVQVSLAVPQVPLPEPSQGAVDPAVALLRLARQYPDQFVRVRFRADGCVVGRFDRDGWTAIVRAAGLTAALTALGLRP